MGQGDDSVVKESLTTQTAEEAAREYASGFGHGVSIPKKLLAAIRDAIELERHVAFEAGEHWSREWEKVLGERWVIVKPDGRVIDFGKSENEAWQNVFTIARYAVEDFKAQGYRAVKVKLVEVPE